MDVRRAVVALVVLVGILVVVAGNRKPDTATAAANRATVTQSGERDMVTSRFHLEGDYRLDWKVWDTGSKNVGCYHGARIEPGREGYVSVKPDGGETTTGTTYVYGLRAGQYHVEVISGCAWRLTLVPQ